MKKGVEYKVKETLCLNSINFAYNNQVCFNKQKHLDLRYRMRRPKNLSKKLPDKAQ